MTESSDKREQASQGSEKTEKSKEGFPIVLRKALAESRAGRAAQKGDRSDEDDEFVDGGQLIVVDDRYMVFESEPDIEERLAISYGANITQNMAGDFLAPTLREGDSVFGLHHAATKGKRITLFDSWLDSYDARGFVKDEEILAEAKRILASIDDDEYEKLLCVAVDERTPLGRSPFTRPWEEVFNEATL